MNPNLFDQLKLAHSEAISYAEQAQTEVRELRRRIAELRTALERLRDGDHVGTPINRGCEAMKIIEDALDQHNALAVPQGEQKEIQ